MTRYNYNRQVEPPAPFVHVTLGRTDGTGMTKEWIAKVDTGADVTVLPLDATKSLGLTQLGVTPAFGFDGEGGDAAIFGVRIAIRGQAAISTAVLAVEREPYVLLGRDLLNRYRIVLDGPGLFFELD